MTLAALRAKHMASERASESSKVTLVVLQSRTDKLKVPVGSGSKGNTIN